MSLAISITLEDFDKMKRPFLSAKKGERLAIPLNMRDGVLLCTGKGNPDWNYSAPHGAGRLFSRAECRKRIILDDYQKSMDGIFSSCITESTIDEAPFAYKNMEEITESISETVDIYDRLTPVYNFKAK